MMHQIETLAGGIVTVIGSYIGSQVAPWVGSVAGDGVMPEWMKWLLGPLGALVGGLVVIRWLADRLDRQEAKTEAKEAKQEAQAEKRELERDEDRRTLIQVVLENSLYTREGSELMKSQREFNVNFSRSLEELSKQVAINSRNLENLMK